MLRRVCFVVWLAALFLMGFPARAQENPTGRIDVFVEQDPTTGAANIYFMDALSGLSSVVRVDNGERFTLVGTYVLYQKPQNGAVMRANADGTLEPHPFIRRTPDLQAVDWVVSPDLQSVAWVQITAQGVSEAYAAQADGSDLRQLPIESPGASLQLKPVALTNGMAYFFYDQAHPAEPTPDQPYTTYENMAEYSILGAIFSPLPLEPNCPCGAAVTPDGRTFARLEADQGIGPFVLHVWDLPSGADMRIPAPSLPYRVAGDLILNTTGTFAVYSVAAGVGEEAAITEEQYALVLVNIVAQQQQLILSPGPERYRPLAFIDDDGALLLTEVIHGGTYKLNLVSGELQRVSNQTYLGTIIIGHTEG